MLICIVISLDKNPEKVDFYRLQEYLLNTGINENLSLNINLVMFVPLQLLLILDNHVKCI